VSALDGGDQGLKPYRHSALPWHLNLSQIDHTLQARFHTTCTPCCRFPHDTGWTAVGP